MNSNIIIAALVIFLVTVSPAFSQKVLMAYKYSSGQPLTYAKTTKIHQDMDIQGQTMTVDVESMLTCDIRSAGDPDRDLKVHVMLDSFSQTIDSPNGRISANPEEVKGKSFIMTIKRNGKVADLSEAQKMVFTQDGASADISFSFLDFFPILPEGEVGPGFKWTSADTMDIGDKINSQYTIIKSENTFEGFENVLGIECAKISMVTQGNSVMKNQAQGMQMTTSGNFTGSEEFYFAVSEGYFVKHTTDTKMTGQIEMTSPESFTFPVVMTIIRTNEIKR